MTYRKMFMLPITTTLRTYYPCHAARRVRLVASNHAPREKYERRCPACGQAWAITRLRLPGRRGPELRFDFIEWERAS